MPRFLLRVAAVNLDNFVFEVEDLSTIRGASLLLLDAAREFHFRFAEAHPDLPVLDPISTGASSGVFRFEATDEVAAEKVRSVAAQDLLSHEQFGHATFVVDVIEETEKFFECLDRLRARGRWRQMRQPSVALREPNRSLEVGPCELDRVRAATEQIDTAEGSRAVSASVRARIQYGRRAKQKFYATEVARVGDPGPTLEGRGFTTDLDSLTARPEGPRHPLHHKMAVIHVDGNDFGKKREELCRTAADLSRFDQQLGSDRAAMLAGLLLTMEEDPDWLTEDGERRIETLLWGGDEFTWVVPAWKGWEALRHFHGRKYAFEDEPLEHAGGIVFCHHKAHVHRIVRLAQVLAGIAKEDRAKSLIAYQVLESFDHAGHDLRGYRQKRRPRGMGELAMLVEGGRAEAQMAALAGVRGAVPRTRLYRLVSDLLEPDGAESDPVQEATTEAREELERAIHEADREAFVALEEAFGDAGAQAATPRLANSVWVHLLELWDYLPELAREDGG